MLKACPNMPFVQRWIGLVFSAMLVMSAQTVGATDRLDAWKGAANLSEITILRGSSLILAGSDTDYLDRNKGWPKLEWAVRKGAEQASIEFQGNVPLSISVEVLEFFGNRGLTGTKYYIQARYTVRGPDGDEILRSRRRYFSQGQIPIRVQSSSDQIAYRVRQDFLEWMAKRKCPDTICRPAAPLVVEAPAPEPEPIPIPEPVEIAPEPKETEIAALPVLRPEIPVEIVVPEPEVTDVPDPLGIRPRPRPEGLAPVVAAVAAPEKPSRSIVGSLISGIFGSDEAETEVEQPSPDPVTTAIAPETVEIPSTPEPETEVAAINAEDTAEPTPEPVVVTPASPVKPVIVAKPNPPAPKPVELPKTPAPEPATSTDVAVAKLPDLPEPEPEVTPDPVPDTTVAGLAPDAPVVEVTPNAGPEVEPPEAEISALPPAPRPARAPTTTTTSRDTALPSLATAKWIGSTDVELAKAKRNGSWMVTDMVTAEARGWVTDESSGTTREMTLIPAGKTRSRVAGMSREAMEALGLAPGQRAVVSVYLRR